ncbi:MAG: site-specific integrase [Treponema sp.]|jgi:integrase|nr:site-specific integrase [Treponema sp.]
MAAFYTLYRRRNKKGETTWYFRVANPDGSRSAGHTTHERTKSKANDFCQRLIQEGRLWAGNESAFRAYAGAGNWFQWDRCAYIQDKRAASTEKKQGITEATANRYRQDLRLYLLPYFGKMKLKNIQPETVKKFRIWMQREKRLSNKTINCAVATLRIMTEWALENNLIFFDPMRGIKPLRIDDNPRDAFMMCEARRMLRAKWPHKEAWLFNLVAAATGLREAEIRALRQGTIFPRHLDVATQYQGKLVPVKTQEARKTPLPARLYGLLAQFLADKEFVFTMGVSSLNSSLNRMMPPDVASQKRDRNLSFHSWRHFFNTYLFSENVSPEKINSVIGHSSGAGTMADAYLHFTPEHYPEVYAAQEKLLDIFLADNPNL